MYKLNYFLIILLATIFNDDHLFDGIRRIFIDFLGIGLGVFGGWGLIYYFAIFVLTYEESIKLYLS